MGVKITADGSIKKQLLGFGFTAMFLFNLTLLVLYGYLIFPHDAELGFNALLPSTMMFYYSTIVLFNPIMSTFLLVQSGNLDLFEDAEMSCLNGLVSLVISLLMAAALGGANLHLFGINAYGDVLLGITVILTSVNVFLAINNGVSMINGFKEGCLREISTEMGPREIENVCEKYNRIKESLGIYAFGLVVFGQLMLIGSIYIMLGKPQKSVFFSGPAIRPYPHPPRALLPSELFFLLQK